MNIRRIRDLDEQDKIIREIVTRRGNSIEMLRDDLTFFQEQVDLIPEQGNIRVSFYYFEKCEEYEGFYNVELVILTPLGEEVHDLDVMFPTFSTAWEMIINQFLCNDNKGKGLQAQMTKPLGNESLSMYKDNYKGEVTIVISKAIH